MDIWPNLTDSNFHLFLSVWTIPLHPILTTEMDFTQLRIVVMGLLNIDSYSQQKQQT